MDSSPFFLLHADNRALGRQQGCGEATDGDLRLLLRGRILSLAAQNLAKASAHDMAKQALARYRQRGEKGLTDLNGEFVLAICPKSPGAPLLAYRSLTSPYQLYYNSHSLSTSLVNLARAMPRISLDGNYLCRFIIGVDELQYAMPLTPLAGVSRLLPGQILEIADGENRLRRLDQRVYSLVGHPEARFENVAAEIRSRITQATMDRLPADEKQTVYSELSGGIDSSIISSVLAQSGRRVECILYNYAEKKDSLSERCARAVAEHYSAPLTVFTADELADVDLATQEFPGDEPTAAYWQAATIGRTLAQFVPQGHRVFSGFGADELFTRRARILSLVQATLGWRAASALAAQIGAAEHRSRLNLIWQAGLHRLPLKLRCRLPGWGIFSTEDVDDLALSGAAVDWLDAPGKLSSRRWQAELFAEGVAARRECFAGGSPEITGNGCQFADMNFISGAYLNAIGGSYETPFTDLRLIDFVGRDVDWRLIFDWNQMPKHLLREAARGILPEAVRLRESDALGIDGLLRRLIVRNRDTMRSFILQSDLPLPNLNHEKLAAAFEAMCFGSTMASAHKVHALIGYAWWYKSFKNRLRSAS